MIPMASITRSWRQSCYPCFFIFNLLPSLMSSNRWYYENMQIIAFPLPMSFHDLAPNVMNEHVHLEPRDASTDTRARVMSLKINQESKLANSFSPFISADVSSV